jgi:hypothetical protein
MKYRIVRLLPNGFSTTDLEDRHELDVYLHDNDIHVSGIHRNIRTRLELQEQPILQGFCGPMYDGDTIRYEDQAAYNVLST